MAQFAPVFLAFLLNLRGIYIFQETAETIIYGQFLPYLTFLFALFILMWDLNLYPASLRRLCTCAEMTIQFLVSKFILEHLTLHFWFPLEKLINEFYPETLQVIEDSIQIKNAENMFEILRSSTVCCLLSYALSWFFLVAVLHATRAIDLRLVQCGVRQFARDILNRLNKGFKKLFKIRKRKNAIEFGPTEYSKCVCPHPEEDKRNPDNDPLIKHPLNINKPENFKTNRNSTGEGNFEDFDEDNYVHGYDDYLRNCQEYVYEPPRRSTRTRTRY